MDNNRLSWMMGGEAGVGIMAADMVFSKTCTRGGLHIFSTVDYPSLIRGGHNVSHVQVDKEKVYSHAQQVDILVALNRETIDLHLDELSENAAIIYDGDNIELSYEDLKRQDVTLCNVPIGNLIKTNSLPKIVANTVALGASFGLVKYDLSILEGVLRDTYERKGESVVESNLKAAKAGFDYTAKNYAGTFTRSISPIHHPSGGTVGNSGTDDTGKKDVTTEKRMVITGNDAIAMAAIRAGLKFYSAYPMTPASSILHFLAAHERRFGYIVKQTEDEIAAINMAIGASYAGVRSMTGTSGGGFSLMSEALGLAAITETPLVAVWGQRPGPSTGLATWTEQSDLRFALSASQGDFQRIVMAPGDASECFYETIRAFNLAEKYQVPVIIMTDKYLAESHESVDIFDTSSIKIDRGDIIAPTDENEDVQNSYFKRFALTDSGISPRAFPGAHAGLVRVESSEHDEYGDYTENEDLRQAMVDKRFAKFDGVLSDLGEDAIKIMGEGTENETQKNENKNAITMISWGSIKGPIKEASKLLANDGILVRHAHVLYINPFDTKKMESIIKSADTTILVENNKGAQLGGVIKEKTGLDVDHTLLKYNGREFYPEEIYRKVKEIVGAVEAKS
ncbi:MAG: 2-oxoacid:acceptor oxidoreductase subunit alpha [Methanosarcinaceae archaeon]|nr:2-oxoacid:acceptor oxidoreductase subunit alpha [Methanosarcinaceae archaeon]